MRHDKNLCSGDVAPVTILHHDFPNGGKFSSDKKYVGLS